MAKKEQKTDAVIEAVLIVDPAEYGLDLAKGKEVETQFLPVIVERDSLAVEYTALVGKEITPAVEKEAKELRLKLVKIRTQTDAIHKTQKAFFLAAGRYIDAWRNKTNVIVEQMEEKLKEIEITSERARVAIMEKLESDRMAELAMYTDFPAQGLAFMPEEVYQNYLVGVKISYERRKEAEEKQRLEDEEKSRKLRLHIERKESILHLWGFLTLERKESDFSDVSDEGWVKIVSDLEGLKQAKTDEDEAIRLENERLQDQAKKQAKILADQQAKAEAERRELEDKAAKERELSETRIRAEREANAKLAAEIQAKKDAELKAEKEKAEAEAIAAKAPRKQKITAWVESLQISTPVGLEQDKVALDIVTKFEAFKNWAKTQIVNI